MENINFIIDGLLGDFIHSLYAMKNICNERNAKGNLYIKGGEWRFGVERAYKDLYSLVIQQPYVDKFELLSGEIDGINLSEWRNMFSGVNNDTGNYFKCWSEVMTETYGFAIPQEYKWLTAEKNDDLKDKILIHRSVHHLNTGFRWDYMLKKIEGEVLFLCTANEREWNEFIFKNDSIKPFNVSDINEMATAINSCKMFVGNQSGPFAIASALDVPRLVELDSHPRKFYMDETKYSKNISWYFDDNIKYASESCIVNF